MSPNNMLHERLAFLNIGVDASRVLEGHSAEISLALPASLDAFYGQVRRFPEVMSFFADEQRLQGAKSAQERHWSGIASGRFDGAYVDSVERIGKMHAKIGLEPRWYIGGYALILEHLITALLSSETPARRLGWRANTDLRDEKIKTVTTVVKAALLDMDIVISTYLEAAEQSRAALEAKIIADSEALTVLFGEGLEKLAAGDTTHRVTGDVPPAFLKLQADFNAAMESLQGAMGGISANAGGMRSSSGEISHASDDLSKRTEQQAATLEETAAALDEITATVRKTAESAGQANRVVESAKTEADRSGEIVQSAVAAMGQIERSAEQISQIIGVIDEIAFQTNLLALNAGVEAARAGDAGRGFAVVASEVRALAQRSAEAAKEIKTLISASTQQVGQGVTLVGQTGDALRSIAGSILKINTLVSEITASTQEQATALAEVNTAVNHLDQITQQNAAMVEESTAASHSLAQDAGELVHLLARFKTNQDLAPQAYEASSPSPGSRVAALRNRHAAPALKTTSQTVRAPQPHADTWEEF